MLKADIVAPSAMGEGERAAWHGLMESAPHLQRAFFAPGFALACEKAGFRVRIALVHEAGRIRAVLPFQFRTAWHQRFRLAERVGGDMADHAGLIAEPGFRIAPEALLRLCRLGGFHLTHLAEPQQSFGLTAAGWRIGHRIDLPDGAETYFAALSAERKPFVNDTGRRLRRAEKDYGPVRFTATATPTVAAVEALIADKRAQYMRTGAADVLSDGRRIALLRQLVAQPAADCTPLFTTLQAGETVLARHLGLLHAGALSYWFPVYDPSANKVSPGRLLLWHTIRQADALHLRLIDRGEGDSEAKRDFSTGTTRFGEAYYTSGTLRGSIARLFQAAEWRLNLRWKAA